MERIELTKWDVSEICAALFERHGAYLADDEFFEVSGYHSDSEVHLTMTLRNKDDTFFYPVDCRLNYAENENLKRHEGLALVLDFLDFYFSRYLREERDFFLPIDWASFSFDNQKVWAKGQIFNPYLEGLADKLLSGELSSEELEKLTNKK